MLRWKKILRPAALCLAALLMAGTSPSCQKTGDDAAQSAAVRTEEDAGILTDVYRGDGILLPEGDWQVMSGGGGWDPDAGEMTLFGFSRERGGEGTEAGRYALLRYSPDGTLLDTAALPTEREGNSAMLPRESGDFIYYAEVSRTGTGTAVESATLLTRLDRRTGAVIRSDVLDPLFPQDVVQARWGDFVPVFTPRFLAVDGEGDVLLADQYTAAVFTPELKFLGSVTLARDGGEGDFRSVGTGRDGRFRCFLRNDAWTFAVLDKETLTLTEAAALDYPFSGSPDRVVFSVSDGDFDAWLGNEKGVYGVRIREDRAECALLMDYENSGIVWDPDMPPPGLLDAEDGETVWMLLYENRGGAGGWFPFLYRHGADVDPAGLRVVEVAYTVALPVSVKTAIRRFASNRSDVRIELLDYTTADGSVTGESALAEDLAKGAASPDLVIASTTQDSVLNAAEKGWFTDLAPWLEDGAVGRGDFFASVLSAFTDGEGKLWGIPRDFRLTTVIAAPDFEGAGEGGPGAGNWSMEKALAWFENLPAGCEGMPYLSAEGAADFFSQAVTGFADRRTGTCSFDSPLFLRYLRWLRTLPADDREWEAKSVYAAAMRESGLEKYRSYLSLEQAMAAAARADEGDDGELFRLRTGGVVPVTPVSLPTVEAVMNLETVFGSPGFRVPGFPGPEGGLTELASDTVILLPASAERPDLSRELAAAILTEASGSGAIPSLKSRYRQTADAYAADKYRYVFRGGALTRDPEKSDLPGFDLHPAETFARMEELLDGPAAPLLPLNRDLYAIAEEELSAYLGGLGTPEDCAAKIQSRASVWLAENQ